MADDLDKWRRKLTTARRRREKALESADEATRAMAELTREAQRAGLSVREAAELVGLTRKAVYDLWARYVPDRG